MGILRTRRFIFLGQENGEPNVEYQADEEADAGNPDTHAMKEGVEKMGILIEGVGASVDQEVAGQMTSKEKNKSETGQGHDNFTANGGFNNGAQGTGRSTHGSRDHPAGVEPD
jgi:hypothetical protein